MIPFQEKKFIVPALKGISAKNIEEHLKLYSGYVKNTNLILEKIETLSKEADANAYIIGELQRRFSFEYNGMRNHEYYFESFVGGPNQINTESSLSQAIVKEWGSFDAWLARFKAVALTRGIGWAVLYYDRNDNRLVHAWIDEQHLGQLNGAAFVLGIDMWEHAFVYDYQPSGKKQYVEDFFSNLNWKVIEDRFSAAASTK
jgi:superoxide dismutase, Fe-Mn family